METTKMRDLGDGELKQEELRAAEQIFRLRFQLKLGQIEGVKKLRALKKDIARLKTIERERALGVRGAVAVAQSAPKVETKGRKSKAAKAVRTETTETGEAR